MIAKADTELESAAESMYLSNSDWLIRKQCSEREDYRKYEEGLKRRIKESAEKVSQLTSKNTQLTSENSQLTSENSALRTFLKEHGFNPDEALSAASEEFDTH